MGAGARIVGPAAEGHETGREPHRSQEFVEIAPCDFSVFQDLVEQAWPQGLACMNGNDSRAAVGMSDKVMRAFGSNENEAGSLQRLQGLTPSDAPETAHTSTATR